VSPEVETVHGRIRGSTSAGIHVFRGIPFARAPRGVLRFSPPLPPEVWTGVREALRPGPAAPQLPLPLLRWLNAAGQASDEDCLSLNVWTPGLDTARRPVLVWIHGGGFLIGSGSTVVYDGRDMARRGDAVVVSLNYRLGAFGYAHLDRLWPEEFPEASNLGVRDQIAALEWVRDNIEAFGGDPASVTVFGQSAGAMSIGALLGAPRARRLFQRAICMSGASDHILDAEDAERVARTFVEELGGPPASPEVLGRIPVDQILDAQRRTLDRLTGWGNLMAFMPAIDGDLIPEAPLSAATAGDVAAIPLLIGTTLEEWKLFRFIDRGMFSMSEQELETRLGDLLRAGFPRAPGTDEAIASFRAAVEARGGRTTPGEIYSAFQSARVFHWPAARLADAQVQGGGQAHAYLFTWRAAGFRRALGSFHALDIPFVFGSTQNPLARPLTGITGAAQRLSRTMQATWLAFARNGDPGHARLPDWPRHEPGQRATMILGREVELENGPLADECGLLASWASGE
jgi:para-nitrobenzyl esterase